MSITEVVLMRDNNLLGPEAVKIKHVDSFAEVVQTARGMICTFAVNLLHKVFLLRVFVYLSGSRVDLPHALL